MSARGYCWAATGVASSLVAMCISITSVCHMLLSLFEIMESKSKLFRANFVISEILTLFSCTCLCTCMLLGITKEDTSWCGFSCVLYTTHVLLLYGVQLVLMTLGLMLCVASLMDTGFTEVSLQLRGVILPMCLFLAR